MPPKHHNLSFLTFYEIMALAKFEILSSRKLIITLRNSERTYLYKEVFQVSWIFFVEDIFKKYLKLARRENKKVWCLSI